MRVKILLLLALCLLGVWTSCNSPTSVFGGVPPRDLEQIIASDTLRVLTMYGPISYFNYKDNPMGYEYEFAQQLCAELGVQMQLITVGSEEELIARLQAGEGDLIAYRLPFTMENRERVAFTAREYITPQVVVQCKSDTMARDVLDLEGCEVYVKPHTILQERLRDLNNEIGGGIRIVEANDSLSVDDLIAATAMKQIPMTVADNDVARLNGTYFGNLDYSLKISFLRKSAWAVRLDAPKFKEYIDQWAKAAPKKQYSAAIYRKYFEKSKYFEAVGFTPIPGKNQISAFDAFFRKYASIPQWDWRLLAAVAYKESKFDPHVVSWAGACGLMQLMPTTAASLGMTEDELFEPEKSIETGAKYIASLSRLFKAVEDPEQRVRFVLAAYNSGPGHIFDARALAQKYGKDPNVWEDNVEPYVRFKTDPAYYTDSICRFGYCRGNETADYVRVVLSKYEQYKRWVHP